MRQPKKKMRFPRPAKSAYQWSEKGGEYTAKCKACGKKLYAPTLKLMHKTYTTHTKSTDCLGGY